MLSVTKTLTNSEIIHLNETPIEILAAPGANKIIFPLAAWLRVDWHADYGDIDAGSQIDIKVGGNILTGISNAESSVTSLLAGGGSDGSNAFTGLALTQFVLSTPAYVTPKGSAGFFDGDVSNKPMTISASNPGNFSGGDPLNTLKVTVFYVVVDF